MYYSRRRPLEDYPNEETAIWSCTMNGCNGWMRDSFSFDNVPSCPHCNSPMIASKKSLPVIVNSRQDLKQKKAAITNE